MASVEDITDKLDNYLDEMAPLLILNIENENYEMAASIRDDINSKITKVKNYIIKNSLTKLSEVDLQHQLEMRKHLYLTDWYELFNIDENRRATQL
jgi:hypothetical protein